MIKFTGTDAKGGKHLFIGLTDKNIELMRSNRTIKINGKEVGCDHDIMIFHGTTEQAIVDMLIASGVEMPGPDKIYTHNDDDRQEGGKH